MLQQMMQKDFHLCMSISWFIKESKSSKEIASQEQKKE